MKNKLFYFDCETTGLNAKVNDIITLAAIVEIDGKIMEELTISIQPLNWEDIEPTALKVNGMTIEQLKTFIPPETAFASIINLLDKYVDKFNHWDKFIPCGYNVSFDVEFLKEFFKKMGSNYFGSYFEYKSLDAYPLVYCIDYLCGYDFPDHKLKTIAKRLELTHDAHTALSDIRVTREILREFCFKHIRRPSDV